MDRPSIYDFAGGDPAFLALAAAHHELCLRDPELSHAFSHGLNPAHVENLAFYWAEVFGGPARYSKTRGGHSHMIDLHARNGIGDDWSHRFIACFMQAADDVGFPDDQEFRAAIRSYMEWATNEVESYAPADANVEMNMPMPRWGWKGPE